MTTKTIQAQRVTTDDKLIVGGEENPLPGGKRQALPICEFAQHGQRVEIVAQQESGAFFRLRTGASEKVRVLA